MHEHRLIERMLAVMVQEIASLEAGAPPGLELAGQAVWFFRAYADRCHHGKEEDILFRDLKKVSLAPDLARIMAELEQEHRQGRAMVATLERARERLLGGQQEARAEFLEALKGLAGFYPGHILKEDKQFFFPCMEYFDADAKAAMLEEFRRFDQRLVHELFGRQVERWEAARGLASPR
ncbi:MAG: hemerythrin domain-containing protein [Desulfarculus sp.]|nr:hemerythrin domain-containing protein [Desulfarculus sp.]